MYAFKLSNQGVEELMRYSLDHPFFQVMQIEDGSKGFIVRMHKKGFSFFYDLFKWGTIFKVEKDKDGFFCALDSNIIYELEIEELIKLIEVIKACKGVGDEDAI